MRLANAAGRRHLLVLFAAMFCFTLMLAAPALAATTYSEMFPGSGTTVAVSNPDVRVKVMDPAGLYSSVILKVDGKTVKAKFSYLAGGGVITYKAAGLLDGAHTVYVSVLNFAGVRSSYTWTFNVALPPVLSQALPAPGGTVSTQQPTVSAAVAGAGPSPTVLLRVDGAEVTAQYDAVAGRVSYLPVPPLANDEAHSIYLKVTKQNGAFAELSWGFSVQIYADMAAPGSCTDCHAGFPAPNHPMSNCDLCHGNPSPVTDCASCHSWDEHSPTYLNNPGYTCTTCHSAAWPRIPMHLQPTGSYHVAAGDMSSCKTCHVSALTVEHNRRTDDAGNAYTCVSCHQSERPEVRQAILDKDTRCASCHGATDHASVHQTDLSTQSISGSYPAGSYGPLACSACHVGELYSEHTRPSSSPAALGCDTCHPTPRDTVGTWDKSCQQGACHATGSAQERHTAMPAAHTPPAARNQCTLSGCHSQGDLGAIHLTASTGGTPSRSSCEVCHSPAAMPPSNDCASASCHPEKVVDGNVAPDHGFDPLRHTASPPSATVSISGVAYGPYACTDCHATQLATEHFKATSSSAAAGCSACHPTPRSTVNPWDKTCAQGGCHTAGTTKPLHGEVDADHTRLPQNDQCGSASCHPAGLASLHVNAVKSGTILRSCAVCHSAGVPASKDCLSCHANKVNSSGNVVLHGYSTARHSATVGADTIAGTFTGPQVLFDGSYSGQRCDQCHNMELPENHDIPSSSSYGRYCTACHPSPRDSFTTWDKTCSQGNCHATKHTDMTSKHQATAVSCAQSTSCHWNWSDGNVAAIHNDAAAWRGHATDGCQNCHTSPAPSAPPSTTNCDDCHTKPAGHGAYDQTLHTASIAAQTLSGQYNNPVYGDTVPYAVGCSSCHTAALGGEHTRASSSSAARGCSACHPTPKQSALPWQKGCVQGGCHQAGSATQQHGAMNQAHVLASQDAQDCGGCHIGDLGELHLRERGNTAACVYCHNTAGLPATRNCRVCHDGFTPDNHW